MHMNPKLNRKLKKSFAVLVAGAFLTPPLTMSGAKLGAATASAQEYPGNYQGYPPSDQYPNQGYPGDYGPPPSDNRYGPPPTDNRYGPPPPDNGYGAPPSGYGGPRHRQPGDARY